MSKPSVFLSHSSSDKPFVRQLASHLAVAGHQVWLDESSLEVGETILSSLADALARANYVLAVISESACRSPWFHKELNLALTRETMERRPLVLPVLIDNTPIPEVLRDKLYADFRSPQEFDTGLQRLLRAMNETQGELSLLAPMASIDDATISRLQPAFIIMLLDQSGSMSGQFTRVPDKSRAEAIAEIANDLIMDLVTRSLKGTSVVDRFYVAALGYGAEAGMVTSAFDPGLASASVLGISELAHRGHDVPARWVTPRYGADAPMCRALRHTHHLVRDWIASGHENGIPPIVFNITDGAATDGDPRIPARNLSQLTTAYGSTLLFNCCLSYIGGAPVRYPASADELPDAYARALFEMSSELTPGMRVALREVGVETKPGARGLVYQTNPSDILEFLTVGTRGAARS